MKRLPKNISLPEDFISQELDDEISDYLSDVYGFCHKGFDIEIKITNIQWDKEE